MAVTPPRVFVSYSHDSAAHKEWVLRLATTLRNRGVDAILDQWDLQPGDDLPHFMEQNLASADFAIMVCTRKYVEKANAGEGGVGYEKMIMTASSLSRISDSKVIPIIREHGDPATPTFMSTRLYVDFTDDEEIEFSLDDLLRKLLDAPLYEKPPIGSDPFQPLEDVRPDRTADGVRTVMEAFVGSSSNDEDDWVFRSTVQSHSAMHRLTFNKYCGLVVSQGLLEENRTESPLGVMVRITDEGLNYLRANKILDV